MDYTAIGRRIKHYRTENNMTQNQLAEKLSVTDKFISSVETGRAKISLSRLYDISVILSVDISCFLKDTDSNSHNYGDYEIYEAIKDWNATQKSVLLNIIHALSEFYWCIIQTFLKANQQKNKTFWITSAYFNLYV